MTTVSRNPARGGPPLQRQAADKPNRPLDGQRQGNGVTSPPLEDLLQAAVMASPERKSAALRVLQGVDQTTEMVTHEKTREPYMTLRQIGKALGFSPCTLWRWQIPGHNLGGRRRFRLTEVNRYLQSEEFQRRAAALRGERKLKATGSAGQTPNAAPTV